jgi:sec-independent protein translocase protein TatB
MFDFAWSEIVLVGVVALIAIGPKDMPAAIRTVARLIKKARRMAAEFQVHVDEMVRDADLHEVRDQIREIRNFDIRGEVERAVDSDGSLRSTLASNPLASTPLGNDPLGLKTPEPMAAATVEPHADHVIAPPAEHVGEPVDPVPAGDIAPREAPGILAPAFIPPELVEPPPAFIPPGTYRV